MIKTIYNDNKLLYNEKIKRMKMKTIESKNAPSAIGPYSQAVELNNFIFVSGQLPLDAKTGKFAGTDITSQTIQSLENTKYILKEAGLEMKNIVKTTILLNDISDFAVVNEIYAKYFSAPYPARATYEVSRLPLGALIEIESIAGK